MGGTEGLELLVRRQAAVVNKIGCTRVIRSENSLGVTLARMVDPRLTGRRDDST